MLERFSEAPKKYHASLPGAAPEGPLSVPEVVARVTQGADQLHLWWAGASGWALWREVSEVAEAVERARHAPTPAPLKAQVTPPPLPVAVDVVEKSSPKPKRTPKKKVEPAPPPIAVDVVEKSSPKPKRISKKQVDPAPPPIAVDVVETSSPKRTPKKKVDPVATVKVVEAPSDVSYQAGDLVSVKVNKVKFNMVYCPAGGFWMGSKKGVGCDDERPRRRVKISKPFLMGQTQVTQALWEAVMGSNPSDFKGAQRPVEKISWYDMARFCNALSALENFRPAYSIGSGDKPDISLDFSANGYRMPTEAEWEYAAKAGTELVYAGGAQLGQVGWFNKNSNRETHPVAQKKANAWGLHDMSGNVWEWCSDQWDEDAYKSRTKSSVDPCVYTSSPAGRVYRGGCWDRDAVSCRVAYRGWRGAGIRGNFLGGRLLRWNLDS